MKICPNCNTQNRDAARFCSNCRENLPLPPGTLLERGRFEIVRELGRGGFGAVYLAQDVRLKRACVVKHLLIPAGAGQAEIDDLRRTFEREADALVGLNQPGHPNIPEIYDFFSDTAGNYLVMKYIGGETLEERLAHQGGRLPWKEAVKFAVQVADALVYMHGRTPPVLHRDIKPANILLDATGRVWLVDFGLSKAQPAAGGGAGLSEPKGTPGYAPPEQHKQGGAVPRSDVYALAATLYHLITGDDPGLHPFQFPQLNVLTPRLRTITARALDADPGQRPTSDRWKVQMENLVRPAVSVQPLTFPQNEAATDLSTLADCCARHWDYARKILYDGTVEHWLRTALHDPVTADKALALVKGQTDQDAGLDNFIRTLNPAFPPPRLQVSGGQLDAGSLPWQQTRQLTLDVTNTGHGALQAQVTTSAPWLTVTPAAFSCVAGRAAKLTVTVDAGKLDPGQSHQAQVTLNAGTGGRTQASVTVTVPAPQLVVDPPALNLGSAYQGEKLSKTFTVRNTGGSAFEGWVSCSEAWASAEPGTFRVEPGRSLSMTVKTKVDHRLATGETHQAALILKDRFGRQKDVRLEVTVPPPQLTIRPRKLDLGIVQWGETLTQTLMVCNTGGGAFDGEVSWKKTWISVNPTVFHSIEPRQSEQVKVTAKMGRVGPGEHSAIVEVSAHTGDWNQAASVTVRVQLPFLKLVWSLCLVLFRATVSVIKGIGELIGTVVSAIGVMLYYFVWGVFSWAGLVVMLAILVAAGVVLHQDIRVLWYYQRGTDAVQKWGCGARSWEFDRALELDPKLDAVEDLLIAEVYTQGVGCTEQERWRDASHLFQGVFRRSPDYEQVRENLLQAAYQSGLENAESHYWGGALEEFQVVASIDSTYKDVATRLEDAQVRASARKLQISRASASSVHPDTRHGGLLNAWGTHTEVDYAIDGNDETGWASHEETVGAWLEIHFRSTRVSRIEITNCEDLGRNTVDAWAACMKDIKLIFSNGSEQIISLEDTKSKQVIELEPVHTHSMKLIVNSVYPNDKASIASIVEIAVYGD